MLDAQNECRRFGDDHRLAATVPPVIQHLFIVVKMPIPNCRKCRRVLLNRLFAHCGCDLPAKP